MSIPITIGLGASASTPVAAADTATATHAAATITYAAGATGVSHYLSGVAWAFGATPLAPALLQVKDGATVVFSVSIIAGGPGCVTFPLPKQGTAATAMTITLADGGAAIVGYVNALNHWML